MSEAATANLETYEEFAPTVPVDKVTGRRQDIRSVDNMPPRYTGAVDDDELRRALIEQSRATTAAMQVLASQAAQKPNGNGLATKVATWFPSILVCGTLLVTSGRWTGSTESEMRGQIKALQDASQQLQGELNTMRTWNERVRLNLADNGWLLDPQTGAVSRRKK